MSLLIIDLERLVDFTELRPKKTKIQKLDWKKTYLFLVIDRLDRYLAWRPVYLNLISYSKNEILMTQHRLHEFSIVTIDERSMTDW